MTEVLRCTFHLSKPQCRLLVFLLYQNKPLTVQEISNKLNLNRTTVQKNIKPLFEKKLIRRYQRNFDNGGYIYEYQINNKEELKRQITSVVKNWYDKAIKDIERWE